MINDLKDFEKFLKICRKQGVSDVTLNGVTVKLGNVPLKMADSESEEIPTDELTPDEMMFYHIRDASAK
jgi:hypothetical protein